MKRLAKNTERRRAVIIGCGFGGLYAARALCGSGIEVVIVDEKNHHAFQPLLYQVAAAVLNPSEIAQPIRTIFHGDPLFRVVMDEALEVDRPRKVVRTQRAEIEYDYLVVAAGTENNYYGNDHWAEHCSGLKTIEDALEIRQKLLTSYEAAEETEDDELRRRLLTFVIVGGGPTGVEMAGAIKEIAEEVMRGDFREVDPSMTRVMLLEAAPRLLMSYREAMSARAKRDLEALGVEVWTDTLVEHIEDGRVVTSKETFEAHTILWTAGVKPSPLAEALDTPLHERTGRVRVEKDLTLPGDEYVYVVGDMACFEHGRETPVPGLAPAAIQMGRQAGRNIRRQVRGGSREDFEYVDRGQMATIGRAKAVAEAYGFAFAGFPAWLAWLVIHIFWLVGFRNRLVVTLQWLYAYVAWKNSSRLIIGGHSNPRWRSETVAGSETPQADPD